MATSAEMPATKAGELWHKCRKMDIWQNLIQRVVYHQRSVLPLVYLSPYITGVLKQDWVFLWNCCLSLFPSLSFMIWIMLSQDFLMTDRPWQYKNVYLLSDPLLEHSNKMLLHCQNWRYCLLKSLLSLRSKIFENCNDKALLNVAKNGEPHRISVQNLVHEKT